MLNGVAPLLIIHFYAKPLNQFVSTNFPLIPDEFVDIIGLPIPIYFDERVSGIRITNESKAIDIDTQVQARYDGEKPLTDQRGINSLVTVNLQGSKDNVVLTALSALGDMMFRMLVSKDYKVTYINGSTVIIGGLFHGFSNNTSHNDTLQRITFQISKASQESTTPANVLSILPKITGAIPIGG